MVYNNDKTLINFLIKAKKNTYAAKDNTASVQPILNGSKQLEYCDGDYFYRDIYLGSTYFVGQETVEFKNCPIWSMVYSGGIIIPNATANIINSIYDFLKRALMLVDINSIYRGPKYYHLDDYVFKNEYEGTLNCFYGKELILIKNQKVYELRYNGGLVR